jgi:hypothetical protein
MARYIPKSGEVQAFQRDDGGAAGYFGTLIAGNPQFNESLHQETEERLSSPRRLRLPSEVTRERRFNDQIFELIEEMESRPTDRRLLSY